MNVRTAGLFLGAAFLKVKHLGLFNNWAKSHYCSWDTVNDCRFASFMTLDVFKVSVHNSEANISSSAHSYQSAAVQSCCFNANNLTGFKNLLWQSHPKTLANRLNCSLFGENLKESCFVNKWKILTWLLNVNDSSYDVIGWEDIKDFSLTASLWQQNTQVKRPIMGFKIMWSTKAKQQVKCKPE